MDRAVFLDRDGTINKTVEPAYCLKMDQFELFPWTAEAIRLLNKLRLKVIVVTNQACIGKGLMDRVELVRVHTRMTDLLSICGARVERVYFCPHTDSDNCSCRKPKTGMIKSALVDYNLDLSGSYLIGDSDGDIQLGKRVGCTTISVGSKSLSADLKCRNLLEAAKEIETWERLRQLKN